MNIYIITFFLDGPDFQYIPHTCVMVSVSEDQAKERLIAQYPECIVTGFTIRKHDIEEIIAL